MSFYPRDQIEDFALPEWGQEPAYGPGTGWALGQQPGARPPTFALKDDDLIEAPMGSGGDFDEYGTLRDLARLQTQTPPRSPQSAGRAYMNGGRGPRGPAEINIWEPS